MANEIIAWSGGECPVDPETRVDVKRRDGGTLYGLKASDVIDWSHHRHGRDGDIIAYRIHEPPPPM